MSLNRLNKTLNRDLEALKAKGTNKGREMVVAGVKPAGPKHGPRFYIEGQGNKEFIRMNSNSYLGMSFRKDIIAAEEKAAQNFGVGPGGVRFICGTYKAHTDLEARLAKFLNREAAMLFSAAYVTSLGVLVPLATSETIFVSDELNHNCIIQAMRLARPADKFIYKHNNMADCEEKLKNAIGKAKRVLVVSDGIFSMRGDHSPLDKLVQICAKYDQEFEDGVISVVDDSHGIGAIGKHGGGTEEYTNTRVDILIGTLGKAFGVNGGFVVGSATLIEYLHETAPMYIYSNPITVSEASAAMKAIDILTGPEGAGILSHLGKMTKKFENGLKEAGFETIEGPHPVVPLMVRDTRKTADLVKYLFGNGVLATGLNYPVVPKGDEEIRFQVCADHTEGDIDYVIDVLKKYNQTH
jgi:glycine C-acetyltransferase